MIYSPEKIALEYDQAAAADEEYAKVKWGSSEKMFNRFRLAMQVVDFGGVSRWLDVGSGTGAFQAQVRAAFPQLKGMALDLSPKLIAYASARTDAAGFVFLCADFMQFSERPWDLITSIGVLQKTTIPPAHFFTHAFELLEPGGYLFIDTKHVGWKRFAEPGFLPESSHAWFSADELLKPCREVGFHVLDFNGFIPETGTVVAPEESHTVFLYAQKDRP